MVSAWCLALVTLILVRFVPLTFSLLMVFVAAASTLVSGVILAVLTSRDWKRRHADTMAQFQRKSHHEEPLIRQLLPYSWAALLYVAASARAADQRVGHRVSLFLGQNRAGGLIGLLFLIFGTFSAAKFFDDHTTVVPGLKVPITPGAVLALAAILLFLAAGILMAGFSVSALGHHAELLERVAALKKNLVEEHKEKGA